MVNNAARILPMSAREDVERESLTELLGVFSLAGTIGLVVLVMASSEPWAGSRQVTPVLFLLTIAWALMIYGAVVSSVLVYKMWTTIQDGQARTSAGHAVGFLFVPFFNLYWAFQAFWGFAKDYNAFARRHGLEQAPQLAPGLFMACILLSLGSVIPLVGNLLGSAAFALGLVLVSKVCDAVNAVPEQVEPEKLESP